MDGKEAGLEMFCAARGYKASDGDATLWLMNYLERIENNQSLRIEKKEIDTDTEKLLIRCPVCSSKASDKYDERGGTMFQCPECACQIIVPSDEMDKAVYVDDVWTY